MHSNHHHHTNRSGVSRGYARHTIAILGMSLLCSPLQLIADEDLEEWEIIEENPNLIVLGIGNAWVDGDEAQYNAREDAGHDMFGGIEYLYTTNELSDTLLSELEMKAMAENADYLLRWKLIKEDVGFLEFGYKSFREWFDATGGYDPVNDASIHYFGEEMFIDRSALWIAAQYSGNEDTILNFKYTRRDREGMKGTTMWADANLENGDRKNIVPGFYNINEVRNTFEADLDHYGDKSDFNLGLVYETTDID
ncbi:MAG: hypothetical protein KJT03_18365, partial [Verrucomicrobiae bacterium]|nr:hypothetical protein [Verrucomicrobiae bacterium]